MYLLSKTANDQHRFYRISARFFLLKIEIENVDVNFSMWKVNEAVPFSFY